MAICVLKTKSGEARYKATIWKDNRPLQSKTFKRKVDAVEWERRQKVHLDDHRVGRTVGRRVALEDFFFDTYWKNKRISEGTASDYIRIFKTFVQPTFGKRILGDVSSEEWTKFLSSLQTPERSGARVNRIRAACSAVYTMACKLGYVVQNPLTTIDWYREELNRGLDFWMREDVSQFLSWCYSAVPERAVLWHLFYETGMRVSEVIGLKRDCLQLNTGSVEVRRSFCKATQQLLPTTKSGRLRRLGFGQTLAVDLRHYLGTHSSQFVFPGDDDGPFLYDLMERQFQKDLADAGVRKITLHVLRHTYASHFVMNGGSIYDLKVLLGHSSIETTMRYAHLAPDHLASKASLVSFARPFAKGVIPLTEKFPKPFPNFDGKSDAERSSPSGAIEIC